MQLNTQDGNAKQDRRMQDNVADPEKREERRTKLRWPMVDHRRNAMDVIATSVAMPMEAIGRGDPNEGLISVQARSAPSLNWVSFQASISLAVDLFFAIPE